MLISVDGFAATDLVAAARQLKGKISTWDSSGIFFDLKDSIPAEQPATRTLLLLYAADLHFRLRWQIEPALAEGQTVVAAPYVETGVAFGLGIGLQRKWLTELFRFAPKPGAAYWIDNAHPTSRSHAKGRARRVKAQPGFLEFCSAVLPPDFHVRLAAHFHALEARGRCRVLR